MNLVRKTVMKYEKLGKKLRAEQGSGQLTLQLLKKEILNPNSEEFLPNQTDQEYYLKKFIAKQEESGEIKNSILEKFLLNIEEGIPFIKHVSFPTDFA